MVWTLSDTPLVQPGSAYFHPLFFSAAQSCFVTLDPTEGLGNAPLAYADVVLFGPLQPSGAVAGRVRSTLIQPELGAFLREDTTPYGVGGWFLRVYLVNQPNATPRTVMIYRNA